MNEIRMARGAHTVVNTCVGVKPGEQVLIITEEKNAHCRSHCRCGLCGQG